MHEVFCDFYSVFDGFYSFLRGGEWRDVGFLDFYARAGNHGESRVFFLIRYVI